MGMTERILVALLLVTTVTLESEHDDVINSSTDLLTEQNFSTLNPSYENESVSLMDDVESTTIDTDYYGIDVSEDPDTSTKTESIKCKPGLLLPVWQPVNNITFGDRFGRGFFYFLVMCYLFLGVSIVSDRFMGAIEKITAIEKKVAIRKADGTKQYVMVRVWNETVANLTLMALGTSAPEILLSIIEIFTTGFQAGELGPGTIVGSAAYNLFSIMALCIIVIPNGEVRRIKHLRVFFVTATFSIFAYIWLYLILAYFSPG